MNIIGNLKQNIKWWKLDVYQYLREISEKNYVAAILETLNPATSQNCRKNASRGEVSE